MPEAPAKVSHQPEASNPSCRVWCVWCQCYTPGASSVVPVFFPRVWCPGEVLRDQALRTELLESLPAVHGIERLLCEAVLNYLTNAIKYTDYGGAIVVRATHLGQIVRIEVVDNGPGIAALEQAALFQEFTRLGGTRKVAGIGLGLSILDFSTVTPIATISLDSGEQGGTFEVTDTDLWWSKGPCLYRVPR
jgi:signal transduction histidine kinase